MPFNDVVLHSKTPVDLEGRFSFTSHLQAALGAENLFEVSGLKSGIGQPDRHGGLFPILALWAIWPVHIWAGELRLLMRLTPRGGVDGQCTGTDRQLHNRIG